MAWLAPAPGIAATPLPTARMQYTAGSFAGIITDWFAWILRPQRHTHTPAATFSPPRRSYEEHTPETVLEQVVEPVGAGVMRISLAVPAPAWPRCRRIFFTC